MQPKIESLLSARLFLSPQFSEGRVYFLSNLSGHLSLYVMEYGGSVPEPLLPPHIALQNPDLMGGKAFFVFPRLNQILVMIDQDGDENYQPMFIPLEGGFPQPAFENRLAQHRVHLGACDPNANRAYLLAERRDASLNEAYLADLENNGLTLLDESPYGAQPVGHSPDHKQVLIAEGYTVGDNVLYLLDGGEKRLLYGKPLTDRLPGEVVPLNGLGDAVLTETGSGVLVTCSVFDDAFSLGYLPLGEPGQMYPVKIKGVQHQGAGEMTGLQHLHGNRFVISYNIDGSSWAYEAEFNEEKRSMKLKRVLVGDAPLQNGVLEHWDYNQEADIFTLSFSTATSPTQIYTLEGKKRNLVVQHTAEKVLGIPNQFLSEGEDASFVSFDGLRISARLYLPAPALGYEGARPLVYYIHGGPQSQERPDFAWFSMPLIQFLTLRGFAVFVPNARGSTGYGLSYTKQVDKDWGGKDRLDHVHAMTEILPLDSRLDTSRAGVVGRSYGGYMTLTQAGRHPELWQAACDMFGPYDLLTFLERIPSTWKPYFNLALGDPQKPEEREMLVERSPKTHLPHLACPMLVIQGRNDPRVAAAESEDLVRELQAKGKKIDLLVFEDEGHDVLKYENRVTCYNAIVEFFETHLTL